MSVILLDQSAKSQITYTYTLLKHEKDQLVFGYAIHILEFIQYLHHINRLYTKLGCSKRINVTVFYTALEFVLTQKPLNTKTLNVYLKELKKVEAFKQTFSMVCHVEHLAFNYNTESILLGLPWSAVVNPTEPMDDLGEVRFNAFYRFYKGKAGVKETIRALRAYRDRVKTLI